MSASREREITSPSDKALVTAIIAAEAVKQLEARSLPDVAKKLQSYEGYKNSMTKFLEKYKRTDIYYL